MIQPLIDTFFAAFATGPDCAARLDALPALFLPQALIVRPGLAVDTVDSFIAPRRTLLTGGGLTSFREWEVTGTTTVVGDIAQHLCTYAKEGVRDGKPFTGSGTKMLQLVRTPQGWRIAALSWHDD
ncbi:nuclear transport factor 2 family protein [Symbioplanes lichenis]|uniref:nuclear transport factor 2 family protein n=1 Tax=Symbioplanes lichenis TaxID=1629072 RepID=UPI002739CC2A|nr:nuclear transport factor 2 family protein [Actinoplanes lichenis]